MTVEDTSIRIENVVDLKLLQQLQDTFAKAMGVAAVTVGQDGVPITETSNFSDVCNMIRSSEIGLARCQRCDAEGGLIAHEMGRPYAYKCAGGLLDAAAPILIDGEYMGSILCGQVIPDDAQEEFIQDVLARNIPLGLPAQELEEALRAIAPLPRERFRAAVEMLSVTANHVIENALANLAQAQLLREAQERAALQAMLQESQMRALKAQINPHFLFNSLTLLSYTALEEGAARTEEIAYTLSDLLRYSLRNMSTMVGLPEEMEMINQYLAIQKIRFGDRLQYEIELDPELNGVELPCMILQPLVENAVIHALEPLKRDVQIQVRALRRDGYLILEVVDSGNGMPTDVLETLQAGQFAADNQSLGLQSVFRRLHTEYGGHFSFDVQSAPDAGTCIRLGIALQTAEHPLGAASPQAEPLLAPMLGNQINFNNYGLKAKLPSAVAASAPPRPRRESILTPIP